MVDNMEKEKSSTRRVGKMQVQAIAKDKVEITQHGSFFQHGNNSGKRDTVAFQGACNECSTNVDDLRISNTALTCLAFQTCMTLCI